MALIETSKLAEGMVLDQDVTNLEGRVLLRKGMILTARHVTALKAWGVKRVRVDAAGDAENGDPQMQAKTPAQIAAIEKELAEDFQHTDRDHPLIAALYGEARKRRIS